MAAYTSAATGDASAGATWVGGVAPSLTTDTITIANTHVVTMNAAITLSKAVVNAGGTLVIANAVQLGDDTGSGGASTTCSTVGGIEVSGTLKASRAATSALTVYGDLIIKAGGVLDYGQSGDAIPSTYTADILLNKSAANAVCKYGLNCEDGSSTWFYGATRTRRTSLTAAASATNTTITVNDVTGWNLGDEIYVVGTGNASGTGDLRNIHASTAITGSAGAWVVTLATALTYGHLNGATVANLTSNVTVKPVSTTYPGYVFLRAAASQAANTRNLSYTTFRDNGQEAHAEIRKQANVIHLALSGTTAVTMGAYIASESCAFYQSNATATGYACAVYQQQNMTFNAPVFVGQGTTVGLYEMGGASITTNNALCAKSQINTGNSHGSLASTHNTLECCDVSGPLVVAGTCTGDVYNSPYMHSATYAIIATQAPSFTLNNQTFGIAGQANFSAGYCMQYRRGAYSSITINGGTFDNTANFFSQTVGTDIHTAQSASIVKVQSAGGNPLNQTIYTPQATIIRDNSTYSRSTSAIRMEPDNTVGVPNNYSVNFLAANGVQQTIVGRLRRNTAYGASTLPKVTISGLGITPVVYTMSGAADAWEQFTINVTQSSGYDGELTLTFTGQTTGAGGYCWLDGIPSYPLVTSCRHYGYEIDATSITRRVDPDIILTEAQANALTGLAIDFGTNTITVTANRTIRELYDWYDAQLCATANLAQPELLTTADAVNYIVGYNLVLNNAQLTGTGNINMGAKTLTLVGTGGSTLNITHNAGVLTAITVIGIANGSRLQLYDVTSATELYNGIPGTSYTMNKNWTVDHTIRARLAYCSGTTAKLAWLQTGIFTSAGMNILAAQEADTLYAANAIDGSTVTEYTADYLNVQIDLAGGSSTTVQRGYAWYVYNLTTALGIANYFGALTAEDAANYRINTTVTDIHVQNAGATAIVLHGARLYRSDGTTIFALGTSPIQHDPDKAYVAQSLLPGTVLDSNIMKVGGLTIAGAGTAGNPWRPA